MNKYIIKKKKHIIFFTTLDFKNMEVNKQSKIKTDLKEKVNIHILNRDKVVKSVVKKNRSFNK